MKAKGHDVKIFYDNYFPDDCYHDYYDSSIFADENTSEWSFADDDIVDVDERFGCIVENQNPDKEYSFASLFRRWIKTRDRMTLVVDTPKSSAPGIVQWLTSQPGVKVK